MPRPTPGPHVQELLNALLVAELAKFRVPYVSDAMTGGAEFIATGGTRGALRRARNVLSHILEALKQSPDNPHGNDAEALAGEMLRQMRGRRGRGQGRARA